MEKSVNWRACRKGVLGWFGLLLAGVFLAGCVSVSLPGYIQDTRPYKKTWSASFAAVEKAVLKALNKSGWTIEKQTDPAVYEQDRTASDQDLQQTLLISRVRPMGFFLGTRYARLNVFIRSASADKTEVEIRYLTVNSTSVKTFQNYRHDRAVDRLFTRIAKELQTAP